MHLDLLSIPQSGGKNVKTFRWDQQLKMCCLSFALRLFLKKNQNAPRPAEHPPVRGEKMSQHLGGIKGCFVSFSDFCFLIEAAALRSIVLRSRFSLSTEIEARTAEGRWMKNPV